MTIDQALNEYTDKINAYEDIDIEYFRSNLNVKDFKEFQELTPYIALLKSASLKEKFDKTFKKINAYKETLYPTSKK